VAGEIVESKESNKKAGDKWFIKDFKTEQLALSK
jgi:hypothetical protein